MKKAISRTKTLHYRRATYYKGNHSLEQLLHQALKRRHKVGQRLEVLDPTDNTSRLINTSRAQMGMLFGTLVVYSPGTNRSLITLNSEAAELDVEQLAPPAAKKGERKEFIDSILYFGVRDNHVVLLQSSGLRSGQFERHLQWLLQENTQVLPPENAVFLSAQLTPNAQKQIAGSHVKKIEVGTTLLSALDTQSTSVTKRIAGGSWGRDVLRTLVGANKYDSMKLEDALDEDSRLELNVEITYRRVTTKKGQRALDNLAHVFRHVDEADADVVVKLKGGGELRGNDFKLQSQVSVQTWSGLVDPGDLFPKMHAWLEDKLKTGFVEP